jgi:hypothetical protein
MSATTVTVDQRRLHETAELPAGLVQSILSTSRVPETRWLLVHCPVSNRVRRDVRLVDDASNEVPERRATRIIQLIRAARARR